MPIRPILSHTLLTLSLLTWLVGAAQAANTLLGTGAGNSLTTGDHNTLLGEYAGSTITTEFDNTLVGSRAGQATTACCNTFLGRLAGYHNTTGFYNIYLGDAAGYKNQTGSWNVFLGYAAGYNETGSNKLYIDNSTTSTPLIYGDFASDVLAIYGKLGVGTQIPLEKLHVRDGNLRIEQSGSTHATFNFVANGNTWEIKNNQATGRLTFFSPGGGASTASFKFDRQAVENLLRVGVLGANTVDINGNLVVTGTITPDYVFKPEYKLESIEAHAAYMWEHRHLPAVGPGQVNAQGQGMVNVGQRSQGMLEELEKAHIYIEQLNRKMTEKDDQLEKMQTQVSALKEKEAQMETLQGELAALKTKEAQLEGLKREMTALIALVHQLLSQNPGPAPRKEG